MCQRACKKLPEGIYMGLVEGWRPLERQQRIYDFMWESALEAFPHRDRRALRRTVCRWVAPTDQKAPPGHCTGAAVDVWLVDDDNEPLDVSSPYDRFRAAPTYILDLSEPAQRNRNLLIESMLSEGFSNCRDEWWHYSFGDAGWAVRLDHKECCYGKVELEKALYQDLEEMHSEGMKERINPFLPPT
jgi:D-alanyl-D-alanine dipeptidase